MIFCILEILGTIFPPDIVKDILDIDANPFLKLTTP